ncbi:MAG: ribosome silencing factor [Traorella sp.]
MNKSLMDILDAIDKAKGFNTVVFDVKDHNPFIEYVVITSASNSRQLMAISDYVKECMLINHYGYRHIEGNDTSKWILVDSDDIVVHVFDENERSVYALEKLYINCERVM